MIEGLNKHFESRVRLGIMSLLMVEDWIEFNVFREELKLTDGNLASHVNALEKQKYLIVNKEFVGKKPRTTYQATKEGKIAFRKHIESLEFLIKNSV